MAPRHWLLLLGAVAPGALAACAGDVVRGRSGDGGAAGTSVTSGAAGASTGDGGAAGTSVTSGVTSTSTGAGGASPGCESDADCPAVEVCDPASHTCVPGCSGAHPCAGGLSCCDGVCTDVETDVDHCGHCHVPCAETPHAPRTCMGGLCWLGPCDAGFADCDAGRINGCEHDLAGGPCVCAPGQVAPCYGGPPGTDGVGVCHSGTRLCAADGLAFGPCTGEVVPSFDTCGDLVDQDCNGMLDDPADADGDGWTPCDGDCCDDPGCAPHPEWLNPGAFELPGSGADDDCDPASSDLAAPPTCSAAPSFVGVTGAALAAAMDICQSALPNPPLAAKTWGLLAADQLLADGSNPAPADLALLQDAQSAVLADFGTGGIVPQAGATMAGLSTGTMRDAGDRGHVSPAPGSAFTSAVAPPSAYLAANGGLLPGSLGCSGNCPSGSGANDSNAVRLTIRVPTNAGAFSYDFMFLTAEYATACSSFNDFHLALLQTLAPGIPLDHNIAYDPLAAPISANNVSFEVCVPRGCSTCPGGALPLLGTGFDVANVGGATDWLTVDAPVVPGEVIVLDLMVFDVSDHNTDSTVLLDRFRWHLPSDFGGGP